MECVGTHWNADKPSQLTGLICILMIKNVDSLYSEPLLGFCEFTFHFARVETRPKLNNYPLRETRRMSAGQRRPLVLDPKLDHKITPACVLYVRVLAARFDCILLMRVLFTANAALTLSYLLRF